MASRRSLGVAAILIGACVACETRSVVPVEVATVDVDPSILEIVEGEARTARAVPRGPGGELLSGRQVSWSTAETSVATVDVDGRVEGIAVGETTLRAAVEGVTGTAPVTVLEGPAVAVSPGTVALLAPEGGDSDTHVVKVANAGHGELSGLSVSVAYREGEPTGWLTAGLSATTAPADLSLTASAAPLTPGAYRATVTVASALNGGSAGSVTVDLQVTPPPPAIVLSVEAVSFSGRVGGQTPAIQTVQISNGGGGILSGLSTTIVYDTLSSTAATGWLQAVVAETTAPTELQLQASVGLLPAGTYRARVDVHADEASNSPQALTVEFVVAPLSTPDRGTPVTGPQDATRRRPEARRP